MMMMMMMEDGDDVGGGYMISDLTSNLSTISLIQMRIPTQDDQGPDEKTLLEQPLQEDQ